MLLRDTGQGYPVFEMGTQQLETLEGNLTYRFGQLGHQAKPFATGILLPGDLFHRLLQIVFGTPDVDQRRVQGVMPHDLR